MAEQTAKGNCYLCGATLDGTAMKNHIFERHDAGAQECVLFRAEGADRRYWLLFDLPTTATLKNVDGFLRRIWVECCGHLSAFMDPCGNELPKSRKLIRFEPGDSLRYDYDFGSTTSLKVSFLGVTHRPPQRELARVLARNEPPAFACADCGRPAKYVSMERVLGNDSDPFLCEDCLKKDEAPELALPVVNSPRMGVCAYAGECDRYIFDPGKFRKD